MHFDQRVLYLLVVTFIQSSLQDIYMHNPRGSNNRLNERSRNRANGNRLFDSQNNNRGGYNVGEGSLSYVEGSRLHLEWTLQHACGGGSGVRCEVVIQYMCGEDVRDGKVTSTIPEKDAENNDQFALHESPDDYRRCRKTMRNGGLFVADQKLKGRSARFTRQNPNGQRRGLECPEERDHFPYWRPSAWKDIAVLTNDVKRCEMYKRENGDKFECVVDLDSVDDGRLPIDAESCRAFKDKRGNPGSWVKRKTSPSPPLVCRETEFSRDNHLGNVRGGEPMTFNWTIPSAKTMEGNCVLRLRYNVSTGDYDGWKSDFEDVDGLLAKRSGFEENPSAGRERGFELKNNPDVKIFDDLDFELELAVNTAQYGRVFQDRSHVFRVISRKEAKVPKDAVVHNLNVRGRRGNIVQVYPAVEYDFVPNTLMVPVGDYLHVQWTGSDSTPNGDGQGKQGTDRNNLVLQREAAYAFENDNATIHGHWAVNYPARLDASSAVFGFPRPTRRDLAFVGVPSPGIQLDSAPAYFNLKPKKMTEAGVFHFFSTRNNNFSNRNQKARLMVVAGDVAGEAIGSTGGSLRLRRAEVVVDPGAFEQVHQIRAQMLTVDELEKKMSNSRRNLPYETVSSFLVVSPEEVMGRDHGGMRLFMTLDERAHGKSLRVLASQTSDLTLWKSLSHNLYQNNTIEFSSHAGGVFYVGDDGGSNGPVTGVIIGVIVSLCLVIGLGCYVLRQKRAG